MPVFLLSKEISFPPAHLATREGLLAVGGDLSEKRLLHAYRKGIFPWYSENEPILWWSPNPRLVLYPGEVNLSSSLKKTIRKSVFDVTLDQAFGAVITGCARVRTENDEGTWIDEEMIAAYGRLHKAGYAHSVEAWKDGRLAGGLYGVSLGGCFFGESMFTRVSNASKVAFAALVTHLSRLSFDLVDCQVTTAHMVTFGAREIPRKTFLGQLRESLKKPTLRGRWRFAALDGDREKSSKFKAES